MATFNNGESGLSVRTKLNEIINKVEGVTSIDNDIDVTGEITADGLTVDGTATLSSLATLTGAAPRIEIYESDTTDYNGRIDSSGAALNLKTIADDGGSQKTRIKIGHSTGDISFYEDTGTTPKFFWDAAAESLGIGTDSPNRPIEINTASSIGLRVEHSDGVGSYFEMGDTSGSIMLGNDAGELRIFTGGDSSYIGESEAMRIDSSGNLLVGKTSASSATVGFETKPTGFTAATRDGNTVLVLNRLTSDGEIINFRKDGTTVGSIGFASNYMTAGTGDTGVLFNSASDSVQPWNTSTNSSRDAAVDLGRDTHRFKDLYLSGGVYLGGTGSANLLDDYETGTWTPTDGSGAGLTFSNVVGTYTKIGRQVFVVCELQYPSTSDTNAARIDGLPFAVDDSFRYGGVISYTTSTALGTAEVTNPTSTSICFRPVNQGSQVPNDDISLNVVRFTILYQTTA